MNTKTVILMTGPTARKEVVGSIHFEWVSATNLNDNVDRSVPAIAHRPIQHQWVVQLPASQERRDHIANQVADALAENKTAGEVDGYNWQVD